LIRELGIISHVVDHTSKEFQSLLEESNTARCGLVIIDGLDSHVSTRIVSILTKHVKTSTRKILCIGHRERKSTSNLFAAKWKQFKFEVQKSTMISALTAIAAGRVTDDVLKRIVRISSTDIRSCINMLEMHLFKPTLNISARDEFVDIIDAIERIFNQHMSFKDLYTLFEHESLAISGGVHENYLRSIQDIDEVTRISESLSASDVILDKDFTNLMAFCACSVGGVNACMSKKRIHVEKYGTLLSMNSHRFLTKKRISGTNLKRMELGQQPLSPMDIMHTKFKCRTAKLF
jgi:hypothetical protein